MFDHSAHTPLSLALGAAFASALTVGAAGAAENPFAQNELHSGYMIADNDAGKANMEGKCGAMGKDKAKEGMCGEMGKAPQDGKHMEGKCGAMGKAQKQGDKAATPDTPAETGKPE